MKKLTVLLLCSVLLLSGCDVVVTSTPVISGQEASQATEQTAITSTSAAQTTTTVVTATAAPEESAEPMTEKTAEALPEGYDYIVPERSELQVETKYISQLALLKIQNEIGYELDGIDLESNKYYTERRSFIEEHCTGEELEEYRSRNYFYEMPLTAYYIGSEDTDWLLIAEYNHGIQISQYCRIALIKDGELSYISEALEIPCAWRFSDGQLITSANEKGLCTFDVASRSFEYTSKDINGEPLCATWLSIYYINDDYIIFENCEPETYGYINTCLYDRKGKAVFPTVLGTFGEPNDCIKISGSKLFYHRELLYSEPQENGIYDLTTHEITILHEDDYPHLCFAEDDRYIIRSLYENKYGWVNMKAVSITRKSDGAEKFFDLREKVCEPKGSMTYSENLRFFDSNGDWLYIVIQGNDFALNFETEQTADIVGETSLTRVHLYGSGHYVERTAELSDSREVIELYGRAVELIPPRSSE